MSVIEQLTQHLGEHAVRVVERALPLVVERTKALESRRTGALADSTHATQPALNETRVQSEMRVDVEYARWQNEGTGIYGPTGARIFPRSAKVLVFDWPAAGGVVFARSVAGSPGRHFWDDMPSRWADALHESIGGPL